MTYQGDFSGGKQIKRDYNSPVNLYFARSTPRVASESSTRTGSQHQEFPRAFLGHVSGTAASRYDLVLIKSNLNLFHSNLGARNVLEAISRAFE